MSRIISTYLGTFDARTPAHGPDALIVIDPMSMMGKNATPSCFKIREVLAFFKTISDRLTALKSRVAEIFETISAKKDSNIRVGESDPDYHDTLAFQVLEASGLATGTATPEPCRPTKLTLTEILGLIEFRGMSTTLDEK